MGKNQDWTEEGLIRLIKSRGHEHQCAVGMFRGADCICEVWNEQRRKENMRESKVEKALKDGVEKMGGICYKFVSPGLRGVPDNICVFKHNKIAFVEVKRPGGELSPLQKSEINRLKRKGAHVYVIENFEEVNHFLARMKNRLRKTKKGEK